MKPTILFALAILLASCASHRQTTTSPQMYWVNSNKVPCTGVAPMHCLQIQKGKKLEKGKWQNFYSNIEGFNFESGYLYKLSVMEEKINPAQVPADGSSIKYTLVEVLEKTPDPIFRIHDIWALEAIGGQNVERPDENDHMQNPSIEINLTEMRIMGTDGCNNFFGSIKNIDEDELTFGQLGSTMKMCPNMEVPGKFNAAINKVARFRIENLKLYFYDSEGHDLLRFKKVD